MQVVHLQQSRTRFSKSRTEGVHVLKIRVRVFRIQPNLQHGHGMDPGADPAFWMTGLLGPHNH
jgi:hypothetical protein